MARFRCSIAVFAALFVVFGCGEERSTGPADVDGLTPSLSDELQSNCYSWPEHEFTRESHARIFVSMSEGNRAVEFELRDAYGTHYKLSELLTTKPVLLVTGSHT